MDQKGYYFSGIVISWLFALGPGTYLNKMLHLLLFLQAPC
jgi:hypothetical protein